MPRMYKNIKEKCIANGGDSKKCKTKAARIYNAYARKKGLKPVTRKTR